jgi:NAD(P)-dependent dehydrogenase (short-subunit alcohol dehydrogenase family)
MKSIVITGVSSGIGNGACIEFINRGYQVFGSVRKKKDAIRLKNELGPLFVPLLFDLTDHNAIQRETERVSEILGGRTLDGLINNAGEAIGGPLMHVPIETIRRSFEILVIGQLAVTQSFLPLLGATQPKVSKPGRILMISSTSGKIGFPFVGPYAGSKHALEGLSKSLRAELLIYGIDVVVIGPGNINTSIWEKQNTTTINQYTETDYYNLLKNMNKYLKETVPNDSINLSDFSKKLVKIFEKKSPKPRYWITKNPLKHWVFTQLVPEKTRNKLVAYKLGLYS